MTKKKLSVYIHIPFCKRKCNYCDFCSFSGKDSELYGRYVDRICDRIREFAPRAKDHEIVTVYFGGGTPSLLDADMIGRMLCAVRDNFDLRSDAEITLECNPATARDGFFDAIRAMGVNRLSIGLQSADDKELAVLGRLHSYSDFESTYFAARRAGFDNISVDLMYGLPDQTLEKFESSLKKIADLGPEHVSAYLLKIEEGTAFARIESELALPDEETQFKMYCLMTNFLAETGYDKYEVSNFAREGFESEHNSGYWTGREYIGFGVAAHSLFGGERFGNSRDIDAFIAGDDIVCERERISESDAAFEFVMLGMRMGRGISISEYQSRFNRSFWQDFPSAARFESHRLLCVDGDRIFFTDDGFFVSNTILAEFLEDFSKSVDNPTNML